VTLLDNYMNEPEIRARLNDKGIYLSREDDGASINMTFYLTTNVEDSTYYREFCEIATSMTDGDNINILIDSPGGFLSGAQMIITGLQTTEATTLAVVVDMAASAATMIALACDDMVMREHSHFMIHAASFGYGAKLHELQSFIEFNIPQTKKLLTSVYSPFMSPSEIDLMIAGKDYYFDAEETAVRWQYVLGAREEEIRSHELAHLEGHISQLEEQLVAMKSMVPKPETKPKTPRKPKESK